MPALDALDVQVWDETSTPAGSAAVAVTRPIDDTWVAEREGDGSIVGFVLVGRRTPLDANRHVAMLRAVAVDPSARREGIGQALVARAVTEARARGFRKLVLTVLGSNAGAIELYRRAGFVVEGRLSDEFLLGGRYVDDVVMALRL
jgi:ribosomal protein S18 acetylase RimI-like enzyme